MNYIPGALGDFLNELRRELVTGCHAQAHVTLLPPRALPVSTPEAWVAIQNLSENLPPFTVVLNEIEVFPGTNVIYLAIGDGRPELLAAHLTLCQGVLDNKEAFPYHPHVTLAQGIVPDQIDAAAEIARQRWRDYAGPRSFLVNDLVFVQNTDANDWVDLDQLRLSDFAVAVPS